MDAFRDWKRNHSSQRIGILEHTNYYFGATVGWKAALEWVQNVTGDKKVINAAIENELKE